MWLAQNWHIPWAIFCAAILAIGWWRYRGTRVGHAVVGAWSKLTWLVIGVVAFAAVLMLIGAFTKEWKCKCAGPDNWECTGPSCNKEASAHFSALRHNISCERSDWPMRPIVAIGELLFSK